MHEEAYINSIIEPIERKEDVLSIELEVGELAGIEAEHLKDHLVKRTGWDVKVSTVESSIKCLCGFEGRARIKERLHDQVIYDCPKCGLPGPEVIQGKDIKIIKAIYK